MDAMRSTSSTSIPTSVGRGVARLAVDAVETEARRRRSARALGRRVAALGARVRASRILGGRAVRKGAGRRVVLEHLVEEVVALKPRGRFFRNVVVWLAPRGRHSYNTNICSRSWTTKSPHRKRRSCSTRRPCWRGCATRRLTSSKRRSASWTRCTTRPARTASSSSPFWTNARSGATTARSTPPAWVTWTARLTRSRARALVETARALVGPAADRNRRARRPTLRRPARSRRQGRDAGDRRGLGRARRRDGRSAR